jgi:transcriptional regulator of acetoin/glycerol metabolism
VATLHEYRIAAEKLAILSELKKANGRITRAAKSLDISRMTLYRLMKKHNIKQKKVIQ